jgi:hypothetical protein
MPAAASGRPLPLKPRFPSVPGAELERHWPITAYAYCVTPLLKSADELVFPLRENAGENSVVGWTDRLGKSAGWTDGPL